MADHVGVVQVTTQSGEMDSKVVPGHRPFTKERLLSMYDEGGFDDHFIRHDVDYSLDAALAMASWENDYGWRSTYYLMENNPFYTTDEAIFALGELVLMGHQVGIHVDERKEPYITASALEKYKDLLVSFHCPTPQVLWKDFAAFHNAYAAKWKGRYWADSNGQFRYGDPEDQDWWGEVNDTSGGVRQQINLHPEWWFEPGWHRRVNDEDWAEFFHGAPRPLAWIPSQYP